MRQVYLSIWLYRNPICCRHDVGICDKNLRGVFISEAAQSPTSVILEITYTEPGLQGDRSTGGTKPATLETGATINVPLFLEQGTKVKVDTRDGSYLGRVN